MYLVLHVYEMNVFLFFANVIYGVSESIHLIFNINLLLNFG
jgi:hypothetical protein